MMERTWFGHPRGLGWLAATEFWERFSYYGMQTLLVLYMRHRLLLPGHIERVAGLGALRRMLEVVYGTLSPQALASVIFGLYAGLVYVTPIAGGLLADRVLGRTRTVVLGAVLMAAGHLLMVAEACFLVALLCLLVGAGCFKGNLAAQVGGLYAADDQRSTDGFQIYFLAINLAVVGAPLVCGTLGERYGYHWGFAAAGAGMVLGLVIYLKGRGYLPPDPRELTGARTAGSRFEPDDRRRLALMIALLPVLGAALACNFQIFNAYLLWAESTVDLDVFGRVLPVTWLLSMGSVFSILAIAGSVRFWQAWSRRRPEPSAFTKMTLGAFLLAAAPLLLALGSAYSTASAHKIGLKWAVLFEIVNDCGYANLLPVGLALYSRAAPKALAGTMIGVYYVLLFFANMLAGWLGGFLERMSGADFWLLQAAVVCAAAVALLLLRGTVKRMLDSARPPPVRSSAFGPRLPRV